MGAAAVGAGAEGGDAEGGGTCRSFAGAFLNGSGSKSVASFARAAENALPSGRGAAEPLAACCAAINKFAALSCIGADHFKYWFPKSED